MAASTTDESKNFTLNWLTDSRHNLATLIGVEQLSIEHLEINPTLLTDQSSNREAFFSEENLEVLASAIDDKLKTVNLDLSYLRPEQAEAFGEALLGPDSHSYIPITNVGFNVRDVSDSFVLKKLTSECDEILSRLDYLEFRTLNNEEDIMALLEKTTSLRVVKISLDPDTKLADSILTHLTELKSLQMIIVEPVIPYVVDYSIEVTKKITQQRPDLMIKYCLHFNPTFTKEVKQVSKFLLSLKSSSTLVFQYISEYKMSPRDIISDIKYRNITFSHGDSCPGDLEYYLAREERFYYE